MSFCKRVFSSLCAFAVMALGVFSFAPFSFAVDDVACSFDNPFPIGSYSYSYSFGCYTSNGIFRLYQVASNSSFRVRYTSTGISFIPDSGGSISFSNIRSDGTSSFNPISTTANSSNYSFNLASVSTAIVSNVSSVSGSGSFNVSFPSPPPDYSSALNAFYYSPFYFPELPYGYFDGNINVVDGSFNLDFSSTSISGTVSPSGTDSYTISLPNTSSSGEFNYNDSTGIGGGWFDTTGGTGSIVQTRVHSESVSLNVSDFDSSITYTPSLGETSRFRTWAVVTASSYCYFMCDTRNKITGSLQSVSGDHGVIRYSAVGDDGVNYPFYAIEFFYDGTKLQTLSALANGFTVDFIGGTLSQDSDTGLWSVDPIYSGIWFSSGSPPVNLSSLSDDSYKWLASPCFGESAVLLNFLDSINHALTDRIPSAISDQTTQLVNVDTPGNFDPTDVENMLNFGTLESDFHAPSTDQIFSVSGGTFADGMTWWRDRMNETLFFSGSPITGLVTFTLTLGLAVLVIGRRVSGGGTA